MYDKKFPELTERLAAHTPRRAPLAEGQREAAVALVVTPGRRASPSILFIKRAEFPGDPWSGQMAFPGGRRDRTDQDLFHTVVRETREEVGLSLAPEHLLGELDDLRPVSPHLPPLIVRPFVFGLVTPPPVRPSAEVALHLWATRDELITSRVRETITLADRTLTVDGYRLGPHLIWGMTERILSPFIELLS